MKYQSYINTLREACDVFIQMTASLSPHAAQIAENEINDLFESLRNEKSMEYERIVEQSVKDADDVAQAVGAGINAVLETIPFIYIGGDPLISKITEYMRQRGYEHLSSINEKEIEEEIGFHGMAALAGSGSSLGSQYPKRTIPGVKSHMKQKTDKVTKIKFDEAEYTDVNKWVGDARAKGYDVDFDDAEGDVLVAYDNTKEQEAGKFDRGRSKGFLNEDANVAAQANNAIMSVNFIPPEAEYGRTSDDDQNDQPDLKAQTIDQADANIIEGTAWKITGEDLNGDVHQIFYEGRSWEALEYAKSRGIFPFEIAEVDIPYAAQVDQSDEISDPTEPQGEPGVTDPQPQRGGDGELVEAGFDQATDHKWNGRCPSCGRAGNWELLGPGPGGGTNFHCLSCDFIIPANQIPGFYTTESDAAVPQTPEIDQRNPAPPAGVTTSGDYAPEEDMAGEPHDDDKIQKNLTDKTKGPAGDKATSDQNDAQIVEAECPSCGWSKTEKTKDGETVCADCGKKVDESDASVKIGEPGQVSNPDPEMPATSTSDGEDNAEKVRAIQKSLTDDPLYDPDSGADAPGIGASVSEQAQDGMKCPTCGSFNTERKEDLAPEGYGGKFFNYLQCHDCGSSIIMGEQAVPPTNQTSSDALYNADPENSIDAIASDILTFTNLDKDDEAKVKDIVDHGERSSGVNRVAEGLMPESLLDVHQFSDIIDQEEDTIDELIAYGAGERNIPQLLNEVDNATPGMKNAYSQVTGGPKCTACGFDLPKYPGAYPKFCPNCGTQMTKPKDVEVDKDAEEASIDEGGPGLMESLGVDDLIKKAKPVPDTVMLDRGKK